MTFLDHFAADACGGVHCVVDTVMEVVAAGVYLECLEFDVLKLHIKMTAKTVWLACVLYSSKI